MTAQVLVLPYQRTSPVQMPRRDLVLASTDSISLRVTVVESDDPAALALDLTGGIGGPVVHMRVWTAEGMQRWWDYGWVSIPGFDQLLWAGDGVVAAGVPGSFDIFIPAATMACWPRRCGWSLQLNFDGTGGVGQNVPPGSPITVGGYTDSEMLAVGALHLRSAGNSFGGAAALVTDGGAPILG